MKKTYAQLKRDANSGRLSLEMIQRGDGGNIPERLKGIRKVIKAKSYGLVLRNADGMESDLQIRRAALVEYDDEYLTIYNWGLRDYTPEEKAALDEWTAITETPEYIERSNVDALTDGSSTYWQMVGFFEKKGLPNLAHEDLSKYGSSRDYTSGMMRDLNVRGSVELKYRVYLEN